MNKMKLNIQLFASSGTITFATKKTLQGKIEWSAERIGTTNSSKITTTLYARKNTSVATYGKSWTGKVKVGSNTQHSFKGFSSSTSIADSWVKFATYTDTVEHQPNGELNLTISGSVTGPGETTLEGVTSSGSQTIALDPIPRMPKIVVLDYTLFDKQINFDIDTANTISTPRVRVSYTGENESGTEDYNLFYNPEEERWQGQVAVTNLTPNKTYTFTFKGYNSNEEVLEEPGTTMVLTTLPLPITVNEKSLIINLNDPSYNSSSLETWTVLIKADPTITTPLNSINDLVFFEYRVLNLDEEVIHESIKDLSQYTQYAIVKNLKPNTTYILEIEIDTNWADQHYPNRVYPAYYRTTFTTLEKNRKIWIKTGESTWAKGIPYIKTSNGWVMGKSAYVKTSSGWVETTDI